MKKIIGLSSLMLLLILSIVTANGYGVIKAIRVNYLPKTSENVWIAKLKGQAAPQKHPTIAVNQFLDVRPEEGDTIGTVCNRSGRTVETLTAEETPSDILVKALIRKLESSGFIVIRTAGWDLSPATIPVYLKTDFILGGRLEAFRVESKARFLTSTIRSSVVYDLTIADARQKKITWSGRLTGNTTKKSLVHASDYFWNDLIGSMNHSLTQAIDNPSIDQFEE